MKWIWILLFPSAAALIGVLFVYQDGTITGTTVSADGAVVFRNHCAQCHGLKGEGVVNLTPPLQGRNFHVEDVKRLVQKGGMKMPPLPFIKGEALENVAHHVNGLK